MDSIDSTIQKPYVALIILPAVSSIAGPSLFFHDYRVLVLLKRSNIRVHDGHDGLGQGRSQFRHLCRCRLDHCEALQTKRRLSRHSDDIERVYIANRALRYPAHGHTGLGDGQTACPPVRSIRESGEL